MTKENRKKCTYKTASPDRYHILKDFAKENRNEMTLGEEILWKELKGTKGEYYFRRQHPIGDFIVDFACLSQNLVIEVDGAYHKQPLQEVDDETRTEYLNEMGFNVLRFTNEEIYTDIDNVIEQITEFINNE
ncbi:MAG: endonuclease domain-containing protein [Prevotella melaninogenica]